MKRLPTMGDLSGSLLVAHPMMSDPNFQRSILYLSHHSAEDGALGFILNRPLGKKFHDLHLAGKNPSMAQAPIYEGGPVQRNQVIIASLEWDTTAGTCRFESLERPEGELSLPLDPNDNIRVFLGYAGWDKNQLEYEIEHNSWLVIHPHPELLHTDADDSTWRKIMHSFGPIYRLLADAPQEPTQN